MIKLLHSADWHLDSPLLGRTEHQAARLRECLLSIPERIASLCLREHCDLLLLSGDIFDGAYTKQSYQAVYSALKSVEIPVFIAPGNHDFAAPDSPWLREIWPENVHIFAHPVVESVALPELNCRIYGAGFDRMDCPALLTDFSAQQSEKYAIGVFHADPTQTDSPYCPITAREIRNSNLHYLALGHIHKGDSLLAGKTLCAWPGCPMGRGYDEAGQKGALLVTVEETATAKFLPLDMPKFFDLSVDVGQDCRKALETVLPPVGNEDIYRITLTGTAASLDTDALKQEFSRFPNLELRDKTLPPVDIWSAAGGDSFEGVYFQLLLDALEQDEENQDIIRLAAKISRQILDGQEVTLP